MAKAATKKTAKKSAAKKPAKKSARKVVAKKATRKGAVKKASAKKGARKVVAKKATAQRGGQEVAKKASAKKAPPRRAPVKRKKAMPSRPLDRQTRRPPPDRLARSDVSADQARLPAVRPRLISLFAFRVPISRMHLGVDRPTGCRTIAQTTGSAGVAQLIRVDLCRSLPWRRYWLSRRRPSNVSVLRSVRYMRGH